MGETDLSRSIRVTDEEARYDAACKRLLSQKVILAQIMKECLSEYRDCAVSDIAERYIEGTPQVGTVPVLPDEANAPVIHGIRTEDASLNEGTITYDVRFLAVAPVSGELMRLIINIEAQNDFYPGYPLTKRGLYYVSRMISSQYGTEFTDAHYEKIKKVYSIWVCMNPPQYRENTITRYRVCKEDLVGVVEEPPENYDLMTVIMLCLGRPEGSNYGGVLKLLGTLFSVELQQTEKRKLLEQDFGIAMTRELDEEVSSMCNLSRGVLEKGYAKGMEKGMEKGIERGIEKSKVESIQNLMDSLKLTAQQALDALKIPVGEQEKYLELLSKRS